MEKCVCGQPYRTEKTHYHPDKEIFTAECPSCGRTLQTKAYAIDVEWKFDKDWKGQE